MLSFISPRATWYKHASNNFNCITAYPLVLAIAANHCCCCLWSTADEKDEQKFRLFAVSLLPRQKATTKVQSWLVCWWSLPPRRLHLLLLLLLCGVELSSRYSKVCCQVMAESRMPGVLYDLVRGLNRSPPHQKILKWVDIFSCHVLCVFVE